MTKVIVAGGRDFKDWKLLERELLYHWTVVFDSQMTIISGGAKGADFLAEKFAELHKIPLLVRPANWEKYKVRAGMLRNAEMSKEADALIAFYDGVSSGTGNMIEIMKKKNKPVYIIPYN